MLDSRAAELDPQDVIITYFRDERNEVNSVYMIEGNNISNRAAG